MSLSTPSCALTLGYTPTVFLVGRRQNIVVYSRCQGTAEWHVADTDDWQSDASNKPNSEGYYTYTLRPKWQHAVTNAEGIRFLFRPLPGEAQEPIPLTLEVIVEDSVGGRPALGSIIPSELPTAEILTLVLWAATAVLGLWAIGDFVTDIWPALFLALTGPMGATERRRLFDISVNILALLLGGVWIVAIIGGGEYVRKRIGQPNSWKLLGVTLAVEVGILLIALFT